MKKVPRVALLMETSRGYGRELLRGIAEYVRLHGPWDLIVSPGDFLQKVPDLKAWGATGVICRIENEQIARQIFHAGLPTIALDIYQNKMIEMLEDIEVSEIVSDSKGAAEMAAEHLIEQGLKNFAFVGEHDRQWSNLRSRAYEEFLTDRGSLVNVYPISEASKAPAWGDELEVMAKWLKGLPKPVGIMACNDARGRQVLQACRVAGLVVSVDAFVIGVDNDSLLCDLSYPRLSSVMLNAKHGGFQAAELLDRIMENPKLPAEQISVEPLRVVSRQSTSGPVILDDPFVALALNFIKQNVARNISIEDIIEHVDISRRNLEMRFKKTLGRTPGQELLRHRLLRARELLLVTSRSVTQIALDSGFCSSAHLSQAFKKQFGSTPMGFRKEHKKLQNNDS